MTLYKGVALRGQCITRRTVITIGADDVSGNERELEVSGDVTPASPGRRTGDPGDWEPDDPGGVEDIEIRDENHALLDDKVAVQEFGAGILDRASEALWLAAEQRRQDAQDAYDEHLADEANDRRWV